MMATYSPCVVTSPGMSSSGTDMRSVRVSYIHGKVTGGGIGYTNLGSSIGAGTTSWATNIINVVGFNRFMVVVKTDVACSLKLRHVNDAGTVLFTEADSAVAVPAATDTAVLVSFGNGTSVATNRVWSFIQLGILAGASNTTVSTLDLWCSVA